MPDPRIRPRRGFAAGGDGLLGKDIILLISSLRALLLPPFICVWLREGVHGVSEGGDNTRGRLGI
jgi:hypothetical protein